MVASGREVAVVGTRGTSRGTEARGLSIWPGTIVEYYTFYGAHHGPVFVLLREHNVVSAHGVMSVVKAACQAEHVVHIDNLLFLLHLAPYFNEDPNFKCCLPVATARPLS